MPGQNGKTIEIRAFGRFTELFEKKGWPVPLVLNLEEAMSGAALAEKLEIPCDEVEVIIVNRKAESLDYVIKPEDRVAFVPWGTPCPYRVFLGFMGKNKRERK